MESTGMDGSGTRSRLIGVVYLLYFAAAICGGLVGKGISVPGDATATVANLLVHGTAWRASLGLTLVSDLLYVVLTVLFYALFKPVNQTVSLLAAAFSLVGCVVQTFGLVFGLSTLGLVGEAAAGGPEVAEVSLLLKLHAQSFVVGLVFFAGYDVVLGYLIYRSRFVPRILGALLGLAGVGCLAYLWAPLATKLSVVIQPLGFLAEFALMAWLLVVGAKVS